MPSTPKTWFIIILVLSVLLTGCDESVKSQYSTRALAEADNLFERGWLPEIIPASSYNISTVNDLDLNISDGEFWYNPKDSELFIGHLKDHNDGIYSYQDDRSTWTFEIDVESGYCSYSMSYRRPSRKSLKQ